MGKILFSLEYDVFDIRKYAHIKAFKKLIVTVIPVSHVTYKFMPKNIFFKKICHITKMNADVQYNSKTFVQTRILAVDVIFARFLSF